MSTSGSMVEIPRGSLAETYTDNVGAVDSGQRSAVSSHQIVSYEWPPVVDLKGRVVLMSL